MRSEDRPSTSQTVTLWEAETGRERVAFVVQGPQVLNVAFSADGRFLVTGATDAVALVWDIARLPTKKTTARPTHTDRYKDLAGDGAEQAFASLLGLVGTPRQV